MATPQAAPPVSPGSRLVALERILTTSAQPAADLRGVADLGDLHFLLYVQLCTLLRRGPVVSRREGLTPARLLSIAQRASRVGALRLSTPHALRQCLEDLEAGLKAAGAWQEAAPLWWHPLPAPVPVEALWRRWEEERPHNLPPRDRLAAPFAAQPGALQRVHLPALLGVPFVRGLYDEAEAAFQRGSLDLRRAGVGASASTSAYRWDRSEFFAGTEANLLEHAPTLAAFVQWCLGPLANELGEAIPQRAFFAPQRAMLARYPAPCDGYAAHLDNPGGAHDNGRALTLVIYLNPPERACEGGELLVWPAEAAEGAPPADVLLPRGGTAVLFDARTVPHQVNPLRAGADRWALTVWFNDRPAQPPTLRPLPRLTLTDALLPVEAPPLPRDVVLFHELGDDSAAGRISIRAADSTQTRVGLVSTVYRGGVDLDAWCAHHFSLGIEHIILILDHLDEPQEAADAARLASNYPPSRLTIWSGDELLEDGWPTLADDRELAELRQLARHGAASFAVAARQSLHASAALSAARDGALGGDPLDWLLHLDGDEWFYLAGAGRGGATLQQHFAAAAGAGLDLIRYLNHELLLPREAGTVARFKVNPRLAAAWLGPRGWSELVELLSMAQSGRRPYFRGYFNGKSAVRVEAGSRAAGVHGWRLASPAAAARSTILPGPFVLHFHFATVQIFRQKYLAMADWRASEASRPFDPSPVEMAALDLIDALRADGAGPATVSRRLDELYRQVTTFSPAEIELLEEAGLIVTPRLAHGPQSD